MKNKIETKVFVYLRTSSDDRDELVMQEKIINAYCCKKGYKIMQIYADLNVSADESIKPELEKLLDDIQNSDAHLIITKDITRLSKDYIQLFDYVKYAEEIGFKIIETVENGIVDFDNFDVYYYPFKTRKSI